MRGVTIVDVERAVHHFEPRLVVVVVGDRVAHRRPYFVPPDRGKGLLQHRGWGGVFGLGMGLGLRLRSVVCGRRALTSFSILYSGHVSWLATATLYQP